MSAEITAQRPTDYAEQIIATSVAANNLIENETIYRLARGNGAPDVSAVRGSSTSYINPNGSGATYNSSALGNLSQCELLTTPGLHDGTFAISTYHSSEHIEYNVPYSSTTVNVGKSDCIINKDFTINSGTSSIYDAHITVDISTNDGPFDSIPSRFTAEFDSASSDIHHFQKALNSRYANRDNIDPLNIVEDAAFNSTYALGQDVTKYFTINSDGSRTANDINTTYTLPSNDFSITVNNLDLLTENDIGTYRIQQLPPVPTVTVFNGDVELGDTLAYEMPITSTQRTDVTSNSPGIDYLPVDPLLSTQFFSFFDNTVDTSNNTIPLPGYTFNLHITPTDSGFSFSDNSWDSNSKISEFVTINDDNLFNNVELMKDWIDKECKLTFTNGNLTLVTSTNGNTDNKDLMTLSEGAENLESEYIESDGQVILNINLPTERTTILPNDEGYNNTGLTPVVYYSNFSGQPMLTIPTEFRENHGVEIISQLVLKNPIYGTNFLTSGDAALNLIADNSVVNNNFDTVNWEFDSFVSGTENLAEIIRIIPQKRLDDVGKVVDSVENQVNNVSSTVYITNLKYPINDGDYEGDIIMNLKTVDDLSIKPHFTEQGWTLSTDATNNTMFASSDVAYTDSNTHWPSFSTVTNFTNTGNVFDLCNNGGELHYKVSYINDENFGNRIRIDWGKTSSYGNNLYLPKSSVTQNIVSGPTVTTIIEEIDNTTYDIIGDLASTIFSDNTTKNDYKLQQKTSTTIYNLSFPLSLRPYTNITCTTTNFTVVKTYYEYVNKSSNIIVNESIMIDGIVDVTDNNIQITLPSEVVTSGSENMEVSGILAAKDINELKANLKLTKDVNGTIVTTENDVSIFYQRKPKIINIIDSYDETPLNNNDDIAITLKYNATNNYGDNSLLLNDTTNYKIHLSNNSGNIGSFSVAYWNSSADNLDTKTTIGGSIYTIDPDNGFQSIINWDTTGVYRLNIEFENSNSTTILNVIRDSTSALEYQIKLKNNKYFATPIYISRGVNDMWRVKTMISNSGSIITTTEIFRSTTYNETTFVVDGYTATTNQLNVVALTDGVYLSYFDNSGVKLPIDYTTVQLGNVDNFILLADKVSVNMIGSASTPLNHFAADGLTFSYNNGYYYSRSITFPWYRGYYNTDGVAVNTDQYYTINRTKTTAEFGFYNADTGSKYFQIVDVYNSGITIDDFKLATPENPNGSYTGNNRRLNLVLEFNQSMLPVEGTTEYPIYTKGDDVVIDVVNPRVDNYHYSLTSTLKTFNIFSFSGSNNIYTTPGGYLEINSTRLRFNGPSIITGTWALYDQSAVKTWQLKLEESYLKFWKLDETIGNPVNHLHNGLTELDTQYAPQGWGEPLYLSEGHGQGYVYDELAAGVDFGNGAYKITRTSQVLQESISFFVVHRPMLKFTTIKSNNCPGFLPTEPQQYSTFLADNTYSYYLPVVYGEPATYNPFATTLSYYTLENTIVTHTHDSNTVNDITFRDPNYKILSEYLSPSESTYAIKVDGSIATIKLWFGLATDENPELVYTILDQKPLNAPLESVLDDAYVRFATSNDNSALDIYMTQDSSSPYLLNANEILGISSAENIQINIPSFFIPSTTTQIVYNLPTGPGTIVNMYTRDIVKDTNTNTYKVVIYKYEPFSNLPPNSLDWNNYGNTSEILEAKTSVSVKFTSRYKKIFDIPTRTLQNSYVQTLDDLIHSGITYENIYNNSSWDLDETYEVNSAPWFSFCSLTINALKNSLPKFFSPPSKNGYRKVNIITRNKILVIKDKLGNTICELDHDGILKTPFLSTGIMAYNSMDNYSVPSNSADIRKRSTLGFARQI